PPEIIGVNQLSAIIGAGQSGPIFVSVSATNTGTDIFVVTLSDKFGLLSVNGLPGATNLTITGTLTAVNLALSTLTDTNPTPGFDNIAVTATGSSGPSGGATIFVTVLGPGTTIFWTNLQSGQWFDGPSWTDNNTFHEVPLASQSIFID